MEKSTFPENLRGLLQLGQANYTSLERDESESIEAHCKIQIWVEAS
jgi:hypothetical protein